MAAISYDPPEILAEFSRRRGITFPLLSDSDSATIKAYGILNTVAEEVLGSGKDDPTVIADFNRYASVTGLDAANLVKGTPYPGTFILDRQGRVHARVSVDFAKEFGCYLAVPMPRPWNRRPSQDPVSPQRVTR